jgi:hypothetical protein
VGRAFSAVVVSCSLALLGCSKSCAPQPPAAASEAAPAPAVSVTAADDADARAEPTSAPSNLPRISAAPDTLALVAVGDKPGAKIVWLQANGSRVWLSGMGLDAYADDDGPLVPAPDLLKGLPHAPDDQVIVVGAYPNLLAYRARNEYCAVLRHPAVFVRDGNAWKHGQALDESTCPIAFVAWNGGALLVESAVNPGWATGGAGSVVPGESGTTLRFLAPDGSVRLVDLALPRAFEAWGASSDGTHVSLVGAFGLPPSDASESALKVARDVVVMRGQARGSFEAATVLEMLGFGSLRTDVREFGTGALVLPPPVRDDGTMVAGAPTEGGDEMAWKGKASRLYVVRGSQVDAHVFRTAAEQDCSLADAATTGDTTYAIVRCPDKPSFLARWDADWKVERVALPRLERDAGATFLACQPRKLLVRPPEDLWVEAACGPSEPTVPAIFRRGRPQEPVRLP